MAPVEGIDASLLSWRSMTAEDLLMLHRWANTEFVNRWWNEAGSYEKLVEQYTPKLDGSEPTYPFIILYGERPIGYIQWYAIRDHEEYRQAVDLSEEAAGVDLYLGEEELANRGLGSSVLRKFLRELVFADPKFDCCVLGPAPENRAAIRCYEKVGFRYIKTIQVPSEPVPEYLMRIGRGELSPVP